MNVALIYLNYQRPHAFPEVLSSIKSSGYPYDFYEINRKGIAAALNDGLDIARQYDAVAFCANDIVMPEGWLADLVDHAQDIPTTGMAANFMSGQPYDRWRVYNRDILVTNTPLGNALLPRRAIDAIGYFNEALDPYGFIDGDYSLRLRLAGFINYYVPGEPVVHLGIDTDTEYKKEKEKALAASWEAFNAGSAKYHSSGDYTIFQRQFFGE